MKFSGTIILFIFLGLISTKSSNASETPSFDCNLAAIEVEKIICESKKNIAVNVRALDVMIAKVYSSLRSTKPDIVTSQKKWIKSRNKCSSSDTQKTLWCLLESYNTRLSELLSTNNSYADISKTNICNTITARDCKNFAVHVIHMKDDVAYFFNDRYKSYLIVLNDSNHINWKSSWVGQAIYSANFSKIPIWVKETESLPEYIIIKGDYRNGCPDCGTQDTILVKTNKKWSPINLVKFHQRLGLFTKAAEETYMYINKDTGIVTVKAAFSDYRHAQVNDLSYLTAKGKLIGNIFTPESYNVRVW